MENLELTSGWTNSPHGPKKKISYVSEYSVSSENERVLDKKKEEQKTNKENQRRGQKGRKGLFEALSFPFTRTSGS